MTLSNKFVEYIFILGCKQDHFIAKAIGFAVWLFDSLYLPMR
ncbi:MAG: hypothetical protein K1060chlam2_01519 [Chlamydiae bacterium]|nr:hypothetical protein [Chlamydiota bacterium]